MNKMNRLSSLNGQEVQLKLNHHKSKHDNFKFGKCYNKIVGPHCTVETKGSLRDTLLRCAIEKASLKF